MRSDQSKTATLIAIIILFILSTSWITVKLSKINKKVTLLEGQIVSQSTTTREEIQTLENALRLKEVEKNENADELKDFFGRRLKIGTCRLSPDSEPVQVLYSPEGRLALDEETEKIIDAPDGGLTIEALKTIFGVKH